MKAQIRISGQVMSVSMIANHLGGLPIEEKKGMFNDKIIVYASVKECKEAIKIAGQYIRSDPGDQMYQLAKNYTSISYDAATAKIEKL